MVEIKLREFFPAEPGRIFDRGLRYGVRSDLYCPVFIKRTIATIQKFREKNSGVRAVQTKFNFKMAKIYGGSYKITCCRHQLQTATVHEPRICMEI